MNTESVVITVMNLTVWFIVVQNWFAGKMWKSFRAVS